MRGRGTGRLRRQAAALRIGVDTGGTFTDLVMLADGALVVHKVLSTPDDPSRAILDGIAELRARRAGRAGGLGRPPERRAPTAEVVHGSTVATNAVLERRGARVALLATEGFEDVLRIGRQTRRELYNIMVEDRRPLVGEGMTLGVRERMSAEGSALEPLSPGEQERLLAELRRARPEAVAVCLLHSYRNGAHERQLAQRLEGEGFYACASHAVLPEYREFERWSTTVLNAYVTPLMARYLERLERGLPGARLRVMQSNGGSTSAASARSRAVQTVLSGPAAGVVGASEVARAAGHRRAIAFDMGGTSTDVCLIDGGVPRSSESSIGDFPLRLPVIDIHSVGAGGGSIAFLDAGGALRVGPRSAGADPGPACYGKGDALTVSDANLLLGRLDPAGFLGGRMRLDVERARAAARPLAAAAGLGERQLAEGVLRVANANMERAIRVVSVERGHDPREFALVAFGGAGGMHACALAESLEIHTVVVPRHAGVLSALGMLLADVARDYSQSVLATGPAAAPAALAEAFRPLLARARAELAHEGLAPRRILLERSLDVRYAGQSYEIDVPFSPGYRREFDRRHARRYGYADVGRPVEVVNLRVKAIGVADKPRLPRARRIQRTRALPASFGQAWFAGRALRTALYRRDDLPPGAAGRGPAILAGAEATTVIPPRFAFRIDALGNVVATRAPGRP